MGVAFGWGGVKGDRQAANGERQAWFDSVTRSGERRSSRRSGDSTSASQVAGIEIGPRDILFQSTPVGHTWQVGSGRGEGKVVREGFGGGCPGRLGVAGGGGGQGRGPTRPGVEGASGESIASNDINAGFASNAVNASSDCIGSVAPVGGLAGRRRRVWGHAREPALRGCRGALRLRVRRGRKRAAGGVAWVGSVQGFVGAALGFSAGAVVAPRQGR